MLCRQFCYCSIIVKTRNTHWILFTSSNNGLKMCMFIFYCCCNFFFLKILLFLSFSWIFFSATHNETTFLMMVSFLMKVMLFKIAKFTRICSKICYFKHLNLKLFFFEREINFSSSIYQECSEKKSISCFRFMIRDVYTFKLCILYF